MRVLRKLLFVSGILVEILHENHGRTVGNNVLDQSSLHDDHHRCRGGFVFRSTLIAFRTISSRFSPPGIDFTCQFARTTASVLKPAEIRSWIAGLP